MHTSVLLQEAIDGLDIHSGDIFLDGTLGSAGHSLEVARRFGRSIKIIGLDADEEAIQRSKARFADIDADLTIVQSNFRDLDKVLDNLKIEKVDKILFDLGLSSEQIDHSARGFTFQKDEPLEMTFNKAGEEDITTKLIVNTWKQESLETIIKGFGEERYARSIAKHIAEVRKEKPIETTADLVAIILAATPKRYHHGRIHPATRTFQALRIAANDELGALSAGLQKGFDRLNAKGRIAVISFHSLEDRIVKHFFRNKAKENLAELITKKPWYPSEEETKINRRARSALLRILMKN